ncbi:nuclear transport factor 2 family protein [Pseudarthrobacter sp. H2]|uniref:nuclear transport factor 2 family protein n=1 Tax=Pseudarthrobacter sp. H2 TaxID=3418415 RepID=UPI003CE6B2CB
MSDLERRIRALEDRASIAELIASYGPYADAGNGEGIGSLWADGGTYTFDATRLQHPDIAGLVELESHRGLMAAGCAHVLSAPSVRIQGDTAVAANHSIVLVRRSETWVAERVSANRWNLVRTEAGWRVASRDNRLLTGGEWARELFAL